MRKTVSPKKSGEYKTNKSAIDMYVNNLYSLEIKKHDELMELFKLLGSKEKNSGPWISVRNQIIKSNLRLVLAIAKTYKRTKLSMEDLIQEGNSGLIKAVEKFDHSLGNHFSTYAHWWIKQAIDQFVLKNKNVIRLPAHASAAQRQILKFINEFKNTHKRSPSLDEVVKDIDISETVVRATVHSTTQMVSMQELAFKSGKSGVDDFTTVQDVVIRDEDFSPFDVMFTKQLAAVIKQTFNELPEKEKIILKLRCGMIERNQVNDEK